MLTTVQILSSEELENVSGGITAKEVGKTIASTSIKWGCATLTGAVGLFLQYYFIEIPCIKINKCIGLNNNMGNFNDVFGRRI